ncbi:TylF/MycF/NovP-related O-methyltransferase [uncultured Shewanella sp.]|uniref:TylF/MycF/NovP-related O-methyltransferase n=1 Tax=uncultured Shewanella sp. TaxID=173975 RepID=UPI00260810A9|nr:TylF/MycF/NovP-related O-methyltransferase [uncultured Shewanella sp.]
MKYYSSYIPDRYSENYTEYNKKTNFLEFDNLKQWLKGNKSNNIGDIGRFFFLNLCIDYLIEEKIRGNVAEIGVYKGNSGFLLTKYAKRVNSTCYLFDTYEGFDQRDLQGLDSHVDKHAFSETSLSAVKNMIGEDNVLYVKGYFPDSLEQVGEINHFSLVHIDCDLEKPISESLSYFYPKMCSGGFMIMHDHSSLHWPGAQNAINQFFKDKPESIIPVPDKSGTCVIRKI